MSACRRVAMIRLMKYEAAILLPTLVTGFRHDLSVVLVTDRTLFLPESIILIQIPDLKGV